MPDILRDHGGLEDCWSGEGLDMGEIGSASAFAVDSYPAGIFLTRCEYVCNRFAAKVAEGCPRETSLFRGHLNKIMGSLRGDCKLRRLERCSKTEVSSTVVKQDENKRCSKDHLHWKGEGQMKGRRPS